MLRLLVLGAMADPKVICSQGGTFDQVRPLQMLKHYDVKWVELLEKYLEWKDRERENMRCFAGE